MGIVTLIATVLGFAFLILLGCFVLWLGISVERSEGFLVVVVFGFGFIFIDNGQTRLQKNIAKLRKNENAGKELFNGRIYAQVPKWFANRFCNDK